MGGRVLFRADASIDIGAGHVMRCMALAEALASSGLSCHFLCRDLPGHLGLRIQAAGHRLSLLPAGNGVVDPINDASACRRELADAPRASLLVSDHYGLDARWEAAMRGECEALLAIDDLADRNHDADMLLDSSPGRHAEDYIGLVEGRTRLLLGPRHALLRPEFAAWRDASLARDRSVPREVLVAMGGTDADNATCKTLAALGNGLPAGARVTALLGGNAPWLDATRALAANLPYACRVLSDVPVAALLAETDFCIGAGGQSALERCALGVPAILVVLAENQRSGARALEAAGAARFLGDVRDIPARMGAHLAAIAEAGVLESMSASCSGVTDGNGTRRVVAALADSGFIQRPAAILRPMSGDDLDLVLAWRNDARIRRAMYSQDPISRVAHEAWFARCNDEPGRRLLILEAGGVPMGFVNLSAPDAAGSSSWGFYAAPDAPAGTGGLLGREALHVAFSTPGVLEVRGEVLVSNESSARFHARLGFVQQGGPREKHVDGRNCGTILTFVLRKQDFRP